MIEKSEFYGFSIEIYNDETYRKNSVDNHHKYEAEYTNEIGSDLLLSKYGVQVFKNDQPLRSIILIAGGGGVTSLHKNSFLVDDESLIIIIGNSIFNLHLPDLSLNWCLKCDDSICFNLYKITNGYVVHGELSITKVNESGEIEWQFYGRDIFVTVDGANNFNIENNMIVVRDWENYIYQIDFSGKEIK